MPACFSVKTPKPKVKLNMILRNNISIITFTLLPGTIMKMCLWYNHKIISHIIYFYPVMSQVFLESPSWYIVEWSRVYIFQMHYLISSSEQSLNVDEKDIIPIWQRSKARQRSSICPRWTRSSGPDSHCLSFLPASLDWCGRKSEEAKEGLLLRTGLLFS